MERRPVSGGVEADFFVDVLEDHADRDDRGRHIGAAAADIAAAAPAGAAASTEGGSLAPGLDEAEAADFLAICAAAERSHQPDRMLWALGAAIAVLVALAISGLPQKLWNESRERAVQKLIHRPDLKRGWKARMGVTREDLGLPPRPDHVKPMRADWQLF